MSYNDQDPFSSLTEARKKLDQINFQLKNLLQERFQCLDKVVQIKIRDSLPIYDSQREKEMLDRLENEIKESPSKEYILHCLDQIFRASLDYCEKSQLNKK